MTNFEYNNFVSLGITSTKIPFANHLWFEVDNVGALYIRDVNDEFHLYYTDDKLATVAKIDIDPGNAHGGDNDHRPADIVGAWHDITNEIIYFMDCTGNNTIYAWSLDYSGSKSAPTIVEMGSFAIGPTFQYDIFKLGSDIFIWWADDTDFGVEKWVDPNWVNQDSVGSSRGFSLTHVIGTKAYILTDVGGSDHVTLMVYDNGTTSISSLEVYTDTDVIANIGFSYDGSDILYFILNDTIAGELTLYTYSISGDSQTKEGVFDVYMMLDRNTDSTASPPNNLEKGFSISTYKIYQIPLRYNGGLNLISVFSFTGNVTAITAHFVMDAGGRMYEFTDMISSILEGLIFHSRNHFPYLEMKFNSDNITIVTQMFIQIIGSYTADGSTTSSQVVFEGIAKKPTKGRFQFVLVENQGSEMEYISPRGNKSGRSDEIIVDINNDGVPDGPTYIRDGTLANGSAMGTLDLSGAKLLRTVYNDLAEHDAFLWALRPQGIIDYNAGGIDSGADLRYDGSGNLDTILQVKAWTVAKLNQIIVNGAINPITGQPYTGEWNDIADQQKNTINSITIEDSQLNSNTICQAKADTMGGNESIRIRAQFKFRKTTYGLIQPGQTITFKYVVANYTTITEAQYILDKLTMNIKTEVGYAEISSGL